MNLKDNLQHTLNLESADDKSNSFVDAEVIYDFGRNYTLDLEWAQKLEYNSAVLYEYEKYFVKELLVDNKKNITVHLYGKDGRNIWVSLSGIKILAQNSK